MTEKYSYLKNQWDNDSTIIDSNLKELNDKEFENYSEKINNGNLILDEYTNRKLNTTDSYFCNFIENGSTKLYGSASAGNANYFGIKLNEGGETYNISNSINDKNGDLKNATKDMATQKFNDVILKELRIIFQKIDEQTKEIVFNAVEKTTKYLQE